MAQKIYKIPLMRDIEMIDTLNGWAVGDSGVILHFDGTMWNPFPSGTYKRLIGVSFLDSQNGWAVGEGGCIFHFDIMVVLLR